MLTSTIIHKLTELFAKAGANPILLWKFEKSSLRMIVGRSMPLGAIYITMIRGREEVNTESYALFLNVDETIFKLNSVLNDLGFQFIKCSIEEFEEKFSLMFLVEKGSKSKGVVSFDNGQELSQEFFSSLSKQPYGHHLASVGEVFLLKRSEAFSIQNDGGSFSVDKIIEPVSKITNTAQEILRTIRLCSGGDIAIAFDVVLSKKEYKPYSYSWSHKMYGVDISKIDDEVVSDFTRIFPTKLSELSYLRLAEDNYFLACETTRPQLKYVLLMTSLESLFNFGREQIAHTISRHLSIILSTNSSEFEENYKANKKLYQLRSSIVHGKPIKENLNEMCNNLSTKTREALVYCREHAMEKEDLFHMLNMKGF